MKLDILLIGLPVVPILTRGILMCVHRKRMRDLLPSDVRDVVEHRSHLQVQAGFAFSAVLALALLQGPLPFVGALPTYYLGLSFVALWFAARGQSYKVTRLSDQALTAVAEVGSLAFFLGLLTVLHRSPVPSTPVWAITALAASAWVGDHLIRLRIRHRILKSPQPVRSEPDAQQAERNQTRSARVGKA